MAKKLDIEEEQTPEGAAAVEEGIEETPPLEVVIGEEPPEEKPEVVTMTPEEYAALKAQSDSTKAMRESIDGLASKLGAPTVVHAPPANAPQQTPEEYFAEHSDEIFDKEKGAAVLAKYNRMVSEKEYGPLLRGMSSTLANTRKELLEAKDPHFKRYKAEIDALVAQQPPEVQIAPDVYERAWITVRQRHQGEIEEETVNSKVDAAVEKKLKELGIDLAKLKGNGGRPAAHVQSEGRSAPTVTTGAQRQRVRLPDQKTKAALEAEALRKGMDIEDLYRIRGYIS